MFPYHAIEVDIDEVEAWRRAPMTEKAGFDVFRPQGLAEQGIVVEIDLSDGKIVGGPAVGMRLLRFFRRERR